MTKVLLIYPYFQTGKNPDVLFPPLGLASLSAQLREKNLDTMKMDCTFLTKPKVIESSVSYSPDIVGFYIMTTMSKNALDLLKAIKKAMPDCIFVAGGPLPSLYPSKFAEKFDFVFKGEAVVSFAEFCSDYHLSKSKDEFFAKMDSHRYAGIFSKSNGLFDEPVMHLSEQQLNSLPIPDRRGFPHEIYQIQSMQISKKKTTTIMMTYGCPHHCDFCSKPIFGDVLRIRSLDSIFDELKDIVSYGYDSVWIADDTFTCNTTFLKNFCERMLVEKLGLSWSCLSRVDRMDAETYRLMKDSGCNKVYLGIESGNDEILKLMNKGTDKAMIEHAVSAFHHVGIACCGFFIVGYPGETIKTIEETFSFALSLGLEQATFNLPYPLPGSKLYERVTGLYRDEWNFEDWNFENEPTFLFESEFDPKWMQQRIEETMHAINPSHSESA
jgi:anaerobic magnesium-protoporphyrin IX monomethyl ester cyclase